LTASISSSLEFIKIYAPKPIKKMPINKEKVSKKSEKEKNIPRRKSTPPVTT
jgi:hypothetical protein